VEGTRRIHSVKSNLLGKMYKTFIFLWKLHKDENHYLMCKNFGSFFMEIVLNSKRGVIKWSKLVSPDFFMKTIFLFIYQFIYDLFNTALSSSDF
jgi:hypothetical protein